VTRAAEVEAAISDGSLVARLAWSGNV